MAIHLLPEEVASQIAAGEVIERPASVVKELLENAVDAQASQVTIKVQQAGRRVIEVADDGQGISYDELPMAVQRHATSKLSRAEDLFNITTLGFRGEALASIASVTHMTIISRMEGADLGGRLQIDGGHLGEVEPVGAPVGTSIRVEDLFYNVPARLQFLKKDNTERRQIDNLVTRYALAYPEKRFQLWQDSRSALMTSGNNDRREVIASLYGVDIARQMLEVLSMEGDIYIRGFISPTSITRSNRREITLYVNGRPVQDIGLATAVVQAYHTLLMVGRYPIAVLFLDMPPEMVDVNVHPTKAEVKFRAGDQMFRLVQNAVRRALLAHTPVPGIDKSPYLGQAKWEDPTGSHTFWTETAFGSAPGTLPGDDPAALGSQTAFGPSRSRIPLLRLVGQIAAAYLVAEGPDGLYLVDQHAAHERVLFEKMMAQHQQTGASSAAMGITAQELLQPVTVNLPPASARILTEQLQILSSLGFRVEEFGKNTFLVRAVPALLAGMEPSAALLVLVEDFEEDEAPLQQEREARLIARVCKRAAVKAGHVLSTDEQRALLADLENCASPRTCPHGRPTMIHLSVDLLERQFGRRGAR